MAIYEIFGKSGFVYVGKSNIDLEKKIRLYRILNKSVQLSDCVIIHPILDKDTVIASDKYNRPDLLLEGYKKLDEDIKLKKGPVMSANSIESILRLE